MTDEKIKELEEKAREILSPEKNNDNIKRCVSLRRIARAGLIKKPRGWYPGDPHPNTCPDCGHELSSWLVCSQDCEYRYYTCNCSYEYAR